jgi:hypothetical protein
LLIGGHIGKFLELFDGVALLDINLLDGAFFDLFTQVGKVEFDHSEVETREWKGGGESNKGGLCEFAKLDHLY